MARKPRIDSVRGVADVIDKMRRFDGVTPPANVPLESSALLHFEQIVTEFARSEWTEHSLALAAMLARDVDMLEGLQRDVIDEGVVTENGRGTPIVNPKVIVCNQLRSGILNLRRSLSLHVKMKDGDLARVARNRAIAKGIEADVDSDDDDLFA